MILSPREQQALSYLDGQLAAGEPRLAAMFGIFTRLTADEGRPPEEDQIRPAVHSPAPGEEQRARRLTLWWRVIFPAVMLAALIGMVVLGLTSSTRCQSAAAGPRTPAARQQQASADCPARGPASPVRATSSKYFPAG
jgi:hypothetical protein